MRWITVSMLALALGAQGGEADAVSRVWEISLNHSFAGQPKPKFDRGLFLVRDVDFSKLIVFDASGKLLRLGRISLPAATQVSISDAAVAPGGQIVVAAGAISGDGQVGNFLGWIDERGVIGRVVRLSNYIPSKICAADDGSIWTAGREVDPERRKETPNHPVLRRHDASGALALSLLDRAAFAAAVHPALKRSSLICSPGSVGFFSEPAKEWIEVSPEGQVTGRWNTELPGDLRVNAVQMTTDGNVYATAHRQGRPGSGSVFRLDRNSARWISLGMTIKAEYAEIVGSDGTDFVMTTAPPLFMSMRAGAAPGGGPGRRLR